MVASSFGQRPSYVTAGASPEGRRVSVLLFIGLVLAPWAFGWLLLRPGYSLLARVLALIWGMLVVMGALHPHVGVSGQSSPSTLSGPSSGSRTLSSIPVSSPYASGWDYSSRVDQMRNQAITYASLVSDTILYFDFPYDGGTTFTLTLRKSGDNTDVMLIASKGQFTCFDSSEDRVQMKFDEGEVLHYSCGRSADGSSNVIFLGPEDMILRKLKASHHLTIEAQFYQEGSRQIDFSTEGLRW